MPGLVVKCDDCKATMRPARDERESTEGGRCDACRALDRVDGEWLAAHGPADGNMLRMAQEYAHAHPETVDDHSDADPGL